MQSGFHNHEAGFTVVASNGNDLMRKDVMKRVVFGEFHLLPCTPDFVMYPDYKIARYVPLPWHASEVELSD